MDYHFAHIARYYHVLANHHHDNNEHKAWRQSREKRDDYEVFSSLSEIWERTE